MPKIDLSICMPTYNFGRFIGETLESIIPQLTDNVEIVILDGNSTDNTPEVVSQFMTKCPQIKYYRQAQKGGIDKDMELSVAFAKGDYCWLFSSDDIMLPQSLQIILNEISSQKDIYLCGFTLCSLDLQERIGPHKILNFPIPIDFDLSLKEEREKYFTNAFTTTAFFSFMSSLVIKKNRWDEVQNNEKFHGSCWAHVARIFSITHNNLKVRYLPDSFLLKRCENDSFSDKGMIHRLGIAIEGYNIIANTFFGRESIEAFHIRRTLRNEFGLGFIYPLKKEARNLKEKEKLEFLISTLFSDLLVTSIIKKIIYKFTPYFIYRFTLIFYKKIKYIKNRELSVINS